MSTATNTVINKSIAQRFVKAVNEQNLAEIDAVLAPALAEEWKNSMVPWLYSTFTEHHLAITDMLAEDDRVAFWGDTSGLHSSEVEGIPATGRRWTNKGVILLRFEADQITEVRMLFDNLNLIKQFGITITPVTL